MTATLNHSFYGDITYEESFWTGKRKISINGTALDKIDKKTFAFYRDGKPVYVSISGNFLTGTKLVIENTTVSVTPPAKWYELVCSISIFVLILVWGNSVALCSIVPIVGGAIGGGISGALGVTNLFVMKSIKNVWLKLLVWLGFLIGTFLICFAIGMAIVSALA